jgi:hypothetical protein
MLLIEHDIKTGELFLPKSPTLLSFIHVKVASTNLALGNVYENTQSLGESLGFR